MSNKRQIFIGGTITLLGLMLLIGSIFKVDVGDFCFPVGLILLGVFLLLRPRLIGPDESVQLKLLGDIRRHGDWQVADEEIWIGVGDVRLDMTGADIPTGETQIRVLGFVGGVRLLAPQGVGVSVSSTSFFTDARMLGQKRDSFLTPIHLASDGYETAERKIQLEVNCFVGNIRVRQV